MPNVRRIARTLLGVAVPAGLVVGAFVLSRGCSKDRETLADVLERHAAAGFGRSLDDVIAAGPRVDAELQDRLWRWTRAETPPEADSDGWSPKDWDWYLRGEAGPPALEAAWYDAFRADALSLGEILAAGDVVLTGYGWLAADAERIARATDFGARNVRLPRWDRVLNAHKWFGVTALRVRETASLDALDRLHRAFARPVCTMDVMVGHVCEGWRDRAYLLRAVRGALPQERIDAWLAEPPRDPGPWADATRGDRLIWWLPVAEDLLAGRFSANQNVGGNPSILKRPGAWWDRRVAGPLRWSGDCVTFLEESVAFEAYLRGSGTAASWRPWSERARGLGWPFDLGIPARPRLVAGFVDGRAQHRAYRVAALLAPERFVGDDAEARRRLGARASLLDAGPWDLGLRCEGRSDGVLRVVVDESAPRPELYEDDAFPTPPPEAPSDGKPFLVDFDVAIQMRLP